MTEDLGQKEPSWLVRKNVPGWPDLGLDGIVSRTSATNYFELVDAGLLNPESD